MKDMKFLIAVVLAAMSVWISDAEAQNPVIQTKYTPDPAPMVYKDTVFLFTDHDEDDAQYFKMKDWLLYSTTDMVNWTFRGVPMSTATFGWAKQGDNAWAAQAIERGGKFYWYVAAEDTTVHLHGIGVAVADSPAGPYHDALGRPLVPGNWGYIDPSVFIDDDGAAYLFWGNNGLWYARLRDDMISLSGEVMAVDGLNDSTAFGPMVMKHDYKYNKEMLKTNYEEGPWVFKRNGIYYLEYAAGGVPEHLDYSTANNINGPWHYQGRVMNEAEHSFTIHGGSIDFKGRSFMFYHNGMLPGGGGFRRSTCVEEFTWGKDGKIPFMPFTKQGVRQPVCLLNPYHRVEAETMAWSVGVHTDNMAGNNHYVTFIHDGDYISVRAVDFGSRGASRFFAVASNAADGDDIEIRLDSIGGKRIGVLSVGGTGNCGDWKTFACKTIRTCGVHDVFFVFRGGAAPLFCWDWWRFGR